MKSKLDTFWRVLKWLVVVYFVGIITWIMWNIREFWIITTFALAIILISIWDKIKTNDWGN